MLLRYIGHPEPGTFFSEKTFPDFFLERWRRFLLLGPVNVVIAFGIAGIIIPLSIVVLIMASMQDDDR